MSKMIRTFRDFSGGLSEVANDNMKNNELVQAVNIVPGDGYGIARCSGTEIAYAQGLANSHVKRVIELTTETETQTLGFFENGANEDIYKWSATDGVWYPLTNDSATDTSTSDGGETAASTTVDVVDGTKFAEDDIIRCAETGEIMLVTGVATNALTVTRGYYGTTAAIITTGDTISVAEPITILPVKSWFIYAYKLYWLDGTDFQVWDGEALSSVVLDDADNPGFPPAAAFIARIDAAVSVKRRGDRWFYGTGADELIFSEVGDPLQFDTASIINVSTPDNDEIKALWVLNEGVLIFKKRTVHHFTGWDFASGTDLKLTQLNVTSGTEFPETIQTVENAVLYLGNNGIYKLYTPYLSSIIAAKNISDKKISNIIYTYPVADARAIVFNNVYYLSIDTNSTNYEYRYYMADEAYYGPFTQGVYSYMPYLENSDKLYIGSANGYVLKYDPSSYHYINTNTGENAAIPIVAKTKGFDVIGNMFQDAKVKKIFIGAKQYTSESTNLTVQIKADYSDAAYASEISSMEDVLNGATAAWTFDFDESLIYSEGDWGYDYWGWLETVTKEIAVGKKCKRMQFIFAGEYSEPLLIYGIGIVYKKKKVKGNRSGVTAADITYSED